MSDTMDTSRYEMVVGLEVHVQLKTVTKAFCLCSTEYGAAPNQNTCPVCLALPGALPVLNQHAVELTTRAALALDCVVHEMSVFARKHYFYPDLPKGYQISQFDRPLATAGSLAIGDRAIRITRVHMEEDAGKSIHDRYPGVSAIDLNRAGVPLIEIVSEPDMRSPTDAGKYLRALREVMLYAGVSDVNMEEGSLRVDANVSARRVGEQKLGTKTEVKNLNSFSNVERALASEFARQCAALDRGERITQQTMLFDTTANLVRPARSKEESHDYRYFPEPDLPPLVLTRAWIEQIQKTVPELPAARRVRYAESYGLAAREIDVLVAEPALADYFELVARLSNDPKAAANWVTGEILATRNASSSTNGATFPMSAERLAEVIALVKSNAVSHTAAKSVFAELVTTGGKDSAGVVADKLGLRQVGDDSALQAWVDAVWAENATEAQRYTAGEKKLKGVLVGLVMKKSGGRADPKRVNQLLDDQVSKLAGTG